MKGMLRRAITEDIGILRPWLEKGKSFYTSTVDGNIHQSEIKAWISREEWAEADAAVARGFARHSPTVGQMLSMAANHLVFEFKEGLGKMVLEHRTETPSDGSPSWQLVGLPLPYTHSDCEGPGIRTRLGSGLVGDWTMCEVAARRVGEKVEETLIDSVRKHHKVHRVTESTTSGSLGFDKVWVGRAVENLVKKTFYGPYMAVVPAKAVTDHNGFITYENGLKESHPLMGTEGVGWVVATEALKAGELLLVQTTPDVIRLVVALRPTVVQWEDNFKVLCIIVPQPRNDFLGNFGAAYRGND